MRCEPEDTNRTFVCFAAGAGRRDPATINNHPLFDGWFGQFYPTPPPPAAGKPKNLRASTIITPRTKLTPTDEATALIAGDAILIRKRHNPHRSGGGGGTGTGGGGGTGSSKPLSMLVDFSFQDYDLTYGRFGIGNIFPTHGQGYVLGRTKEGERLEVNILQMWDKMAKGESLESISLGRTEEEIYEKIAEIGKSGPTLKDIKRERMQKKGKQRQTRP